MLPAPADERAAAVLDFWFAAESMAHWFERDDAFDAQIRERFGALSEIAVEGGLDAWREDVADSLALLLLLDQFPRNLHRDEARAFAGDAAARRVALDLIARGVDAAMSVSQRLFVYLPLEHAEDLALQQRSVALFEALAASAAEAERPAAQQYLDYARRHREVIEKFGRFPGRNAALGRETTAAERDWMEVHGGF